MDKRTLKRFRRKVMQHRDTLRAWLSQEDASEVLSRCGIDACASDSEVETLAALDTALDQIQHGTFGRCTLCKDTVEIERLELDFTTCVCLDHYTETQRRDLERDLELAAQVQQHLFPCCWPALPGFDLAAHAHPAHIVSGDYYDFFYSADQVQGMVIADVMGSGLPAGMLMSNLQASLRILGPEYDDLAALATRLNTLFRYNLKLIRFISICLATIDIETGQLRYCNAGHNPPLLWRAASGTAHWLKPTGPAIGLMHEPTYRSETLQLQPGDVLVFYTDGLVEVRQNGEAIFDETHLAQFVAHHAEEPADVLLTGLRQAAARLAGGQLNDDVALLVLKRL